MNRPTKICTRVRSSFEWKLAETSLWWALMLQINQIDGVQVRIYASRLFPGEGINL